MREKKKVIRIFSRLNIGGPSLHVVNLTKGLTDYGYDTTLLVGEAPKWEGDMLSYASQQAVDPQFVSGLRPSISVWNDARAFFHILKILRRERPDIVHTHTFKAGLLGRIAAWLTGTPVIVHTYHGHLFHGYGNPFKTFIVKWIEKILGLITDRTITVSKKVANEILKKV